jgi:hypothetical protein
VSAAGNAADVSLKASVRRSPPLDHDKDATVTYTKPNIFNCEELTELDQKTRDEMPDDVRDLYAMVSGVYVGCRQAETNEADARANLTQLVRNEQDIQSQFNKLTTTDRITETRRAQVAYNNARVGLPPPPAPKIDPAAKKLAKEIEAIQASIAVARTILVNAEIATRRARGELADAIAIWQGPPIPRHEAVRDHLRRSAEHARNTKPVVEEVRVASQLDAVLSGPKKNVNLGSKRVVRPARAVKTR